jgi:GMP synthase-like glutamine amidotransferase
MTVSVRDDDAIRGVALQLQDDAPLGLLSDWAADRRLGLDVVRPDQGEPLPEPSAIAFAAVLGSERSVVGPDPGWIGGLLDWLRAADAAAVPVLGICFGAQALAAALGGRVHRLPEREIGWISVESADPERIAPGPWLTWHEDGIELPPLAYELARNAFGVQAFCHCRHLAVQFHPEVTPAIVADWARGDGPPELDPAALLQATTKHAHAAAAAAARLFDGFAARAGLSAVASGA